VLNGGVRPHPSNWRSILFSSMILASKGMSFDAICPVAPVVIVSVFVKYKV